jgi:hypothetical protein
VVSSTAILAGSMVPGAKPVPVTATDVPSRAAGGEVRAASRRLGLSIDNADRRADAYVRVPSNKEAVFRAAVISNGVPVSDILQVWLDVSTHPARGREQADEIRKRLIGPLMRKVR